MTTNHLKTTKMLRITYIPHTMDNVLTNNSVMNQQLLQTFT